MASLFQTLADTVGMKSRFIFAGLLLQLTAPFAHAVSLFGIELAQTQRPELRDAVKQAGAVLEKEAGEGEFFDRYGSQTLLPGSDKLFLGFVKADQQFAFAEYEFHGFRHPRMLSRLTERYGEAEVLKQDYLSDTVLRWQNQGIEILWFQDWSQYKFRLQYRHPQNLTRLLDEKQAYEQQQQTLQDQVGANAF